MSRAAGSLSGWWLAMLCVRSFKQVQDLSCALKFLVWFLTITMHPLTRLLRDCIVVQVLHWHAVTLIRSRWHMKRCLSRTHKMTSNNSLCFFTLSVSHTLHHLIDVCWCAHKISPSYWLKFLDPSLYEGVRLNGHSPILMSSNRNWNQPKLMQANVTTRSYM